MITKFKSKIYLTVGAVVALVVYISYYHADMISQTSKKNMCKAKSKALSVEFSGILRKKYKDSKDHQIEKIVVGSGKNKVKSSFLASEISGFFEKVEIGDSLIKKHGSLDVEVYRGHYRTIFNLDYMCP